MYDVNGYHLSCSEKKKCNMNGKNACREYELYEHNSARVGTPIVCCISSKLLRYPKYVQQVALFPSLQESIINSSEY